MKQFFFRLSYLVLAVLWCIALIIFVLCGSIRWLFTGKPLGDFAVEIVDRIQKLGKK